jgi:AcrR family transcriptional regulator
VFAARGYENASLEAIGEGAGVTAATVYRHFRNKSHLLFAVIERAIESVPLSERLRAHDIPSPADFADVTAAYVDPAHTTVRKLSVELHAAAGRNADVQALWLEFNRRVRRSYVRQLQAGVAAGVVRADLDTESTATLLLVVIMGLCHLDTFEPDLVGNRRWTDFLTSTVAGLLTPVGPAPTRRQRAQRA